MAARSVRSDMYGLRRATVVQVRVIHALVLRELVVEGGHASIPFMRIFLRPVAIVAAFYVAGLSISGLAPQGFPLLVFIVTGYLVWIGFERCFVGVNYRSSARLLMIPHVTPLDLMLGRVVFEFAAYFTLFIALCLVCVIFEQVPLPADPLAVFLAFGSALALGLSLGMILASLRRFTTVFDDTTLVIRMVGHVLSGCFALATSTPAFLLDIMKWNPLFHSVEWLREAWWPAYVSPIADPKYIFICLFFITAIALAFERATRRWEGE